MARKDTAQISFHNAFIGALAVGAFNAPVTPNSSVISATRLLSEADGYAHFRVRKLAFRLHPSSSAVASIAVGFVGGVQDTIPQNFTQVGELLSSTVLGGKAVVPTGWVIPSRAELAGPLPWYKTVPGTTGATEEQPGFLVLGGTSADPFTLEVRGVIEFKTGVATGNTPEEVAALAALRRARVETAQRRAREGLLSVLSLPPVLTGPKGSAV